MALFTVHGTWWFPKGKTMQFEERITIKAMPEEIFSAYVDVSAWSSWDPDIQSSSIEGEFKRGATGKLKPVNGPEAKIEITQVTKNKSFSTISKLPFCTMRFEHEILPLDEEVEVVHRVVFSGLLSPLIGRLIGSGIKKGLPSTLRGLKKTIESKC